MARELRRGIRKRARAFESAQAAADLLRAARASRECSVDYSLMLLLLLLMPGCVGIIVGVRGTYLKQKHEKRIVVVGVWLISIGMAQVWIGLWIF